jgi:DNA polymerase
LLDSGNLYQALSALEDYYIDSYKSKIVLPQIVPVHDESLSAIAEEISRCRLCRLVSGRTNVVPGIGVDKPLVMVIGEGPGSEEDKKGEPFVGPAGLLLDKMLEAIGLFRGVNCFITNIVKCRPPNNRAPAPDEQAACNSFLQRQIALLQPSAILALGRVAAQALLQSHEGIGELRNIEHRYKDIPLIASYHPSALLRNTEYKRPAWEDLKLLRSVLQKLHPDRI